jgi:hypothetical protein
MEFRNDLPDTHSMKAPKYAAEATEARTAKGQWGLLTVITPKDESDVQRAGTRARLLAHAVRTGRLAAFRPASSYEAATRVRTTLRIDAPAQEYAVYIRFVGDPS